MAIKKTPTTLPEIQRMLDMAHGPRIEGAPEIVKAKTFPQVVIDETTAEGTECQIFKRNNGFSCNYSKDGISIHSTYILEGTFSQGGAHSDSRARADVRLANSYTTIPLNTGEYVKNAYIGDMNEDGFVDVALESNLGTWILLFDKTL